jgi:RNA polymerase sigma-70 factor (ECF subfamily)
MSESVDFRNLLERVRQGDDDSATELVRQFEPELRRVIRVRLTDPRLRRVFDSGDVCQSVLANFFVRVALGEFELNRPEQLFDLLMVMARNKLRDQARRHQAQRRDQRRIEAVDPILDALPGANDDPGRIVAARDLLSEVRRQLSDEERVLAEHRAQGLEWPEIAERLGGRPDALRKKLTRALDRIADRLGLKEIDVA